MTLLSNRTKMMLLTGLVCLFAAGTAAAQNPATCVNDDDCTATPACGGDVCDWSVLGQMICKPAGSQPKGSDGWCTTTDDCKCKGMGATCVTAFCTFTRPCEADGGSCASGGTGGGTGGSSGTGGGTGTAGTGGGGDSGGCSVAATTPTAASTLLVAIGLLAFARRRRGD
jgi:MprA protease rhombosortase-interaction domain-containing protein